MVRTLSEAFKFLWFSVRDNFYNGVPSVLVVDMKGNANACNQNYRYQKDDKCVWKQAG